MPWRDLGPMEQRLEFMRDHRSGLYLMTELAEQYRHEPQDGVQMARALRGGERGGLHDRSRRPHRRPQATDPEVIAALIALRRRHPRWGPKLLALGCKQHPPWAWPSRSTASDILRRAGVVPRMQAGRRAHHRPRWRQLRRPMARGPPISRANFGPEMGTTVIR